MYGAILGDMIGSPYEFDMGDKTKVFPLFSKRSCFTDDSVMTIAVADASLDAQPDADVEWMYYSHEWFFQFLPGSGQISGHRR